MPYSWKRLYVYSWKNNPQMGLFPCPKRITLHGRVCQVVARGAMNSAVVEFLDNQQRECVSRNALRRNSVTENGHSIDTPSGSD